MSIQNIQTSTQNNELYQIRKRTEAQNAEQVQAQQAVQEVVQSDEYDKANKLGEEPEGIYSVSYNDDGSVKVSYTQPASKSGAQSGAAQNAGGTQAVSSTSKSDDDTEKKIEKLKKQRDQIKQQLNKAQDEDTKKALRAQLQAIEAQIAQLTAQQK